MKKGLIVAIIAIVIVSVVAFLIFKKNDNSFLTASMKRQKLINYFVSKNEPITDILNSMTDAEIEVVYNVLFNYVEKNMPPPQGTDLYNSFNAISTKYNIFT